MAEREKSARKTAKCALFTPPCSSIAFRFAPGAMLCTIFLLQGQSNRTEFQQPMENWGVVLCQNGMLALSRF